MGLDKWACAKQSQKLLDDEQSGSHQLAGPVSTGKRACLYRLICPSLVGRNSEVILGHFRQKLDRC